MLDALAIMSGTVDLDDQACLSAEEVDDVWLDRMLASKLQAGGSMA